MKKFLKIVSFPVRLVLFLVIALIAALMYVLNRTLGMFIVLASGIIAFIGAVMSGLTVIAGLIWAGLLIFSENAVVMRDNIPFLIISGVLLLIVSALLMSAPVLADKIYSAVFTAAAWTFGFSKMILKCDTTELY